MRIRIQIQAFSAGLGKDINRGKDGGPCTHNQPAEEVGWWEVFFGWAGYNFELWLKIQDQT
jgi:hypothetical protein